jgi:hypothetical protein
MAQYTPPPQPGAIFGYEILDDLCTRGIYNPDTAALSAWGESGSGVGRYDVSPNFHITCRKERNTCSAG